MGVCPSCFSSSCALFVLFTLHFVDLPTILLRINASTIVHFGPLFRFPAK